MKKRFKKRFKMGRKASRRQFTKYAKRTKRRNWAPNPMRGGIRA